MELLGLHQECSLDFFVIRSFRHSEQIYNTTEVINKLNLKLAQYLPYKSSYDCLPLQSVVEVLNDLFGVIIAILRSGTL